MADIFLSYTRSDQSRIERLATSLEAAGYSVWWDRHIDGGSEFSADIERELEAAMAVVVAWSKESTQSRWVRDEASLALEAEKLVAITLDGSAPPLGFRQIHAIDMQRANGLDDLKRSLTNRLDRPVAPATPIASPKSSRRGFRVGIIAILLLSIVGLGFFVWHGRSGVEGAAVDAASEKSLAILPFRDLSPGQDQQWFTDGLAEEITSTLARAPDLIVAPRAASFRYRDGMTGPETISRELGVNHILDGSVRRDEVNMRISVELIRASDGARIWSQDYDRTTDAAIDVQEDIASEVARALETAMDPEALASMVDTGTNSIEAYEAFLKSGERLENLTSPRDSIDFAVKAYEIDPDFSRAYLRAAGQRIDAMTALYFAFESKDVAIAELPTFEAEVELAIAKAKDPADREFAEALRDRAQFRLRDAHEHLLNVLAQRPNDVDALGLLGDIQIIFGDFEAAKETLDRYTAALPVDNGYAVSSYVFMGEVDAAIALARRSLERNPREATMLYQLHRALMWAGEVEEGARILRRLENADGSETGLPLARIRQACIEGRIEDVPALLQESQGVDYISLQPLLVAGYRERAYESIRELDRAEPPIILAELPVHPVFDLSRLPNLSRLLEEQGITPRAPKPMPFACPSSER